MSPPLFAMVSATLLALASSAAFANVVAPFPVSAPSRSAERQVSKDPNVPSAADALFAYAQMVRWGHLRHDARRQARAARVFRADLYHAFVGEAPMPEPPRMFDGIACDDDVEAYVRRFAIATPYDSLPFPAS